jgi:hypothetical protein
VVASTASEAAASEMVLVRTCCLRSTV